LAVKRIVANIGVKDVGRAKAFYGDLLGMDVVMDHGWIVTFATDASTTPQVSIAASNVVNGVKLAEVSDSDLDNFLNTISGSQCLSTRYR